jgi:hypothetical protein
MSCRSWFGVHICAYVFVTCSASGLDAGVGTGCKRRALQALKELLLSL